MKRVVVVALFELFQSAHGVVMYDGKGLRTVETPGGQRQQQWAAAADMLAGARNKGDGGTGLPSDPLITEFQQGVTTACVEPTAKLAEVAVLVYLTERQRFSP